MVLQPEDIAMADDLLLKVRHDSHLLKVLEHDVVLVHGFEEQKIWAYFALPVAWYLGTEALDPVRLQTVSIEFGYVAFQRVLCQNQNSRSLLLVGV